jgi:hypothetical protein
VAQPGVKATISLGVKGAGLAAGNAPSSPEPELASSAEGTSDGATAAEAEQPAAQAIQPEPAAETASLEGSESLS